MIVVPGGLEVFDHGIQTTMPMQRLFSPSVGELNMNSCAFSTGIDGDPSRLMRQHLHTSFKLPCGVVKA